VNPTSVQCAETIVNGLISSGVKYFVVAPGSRNGPISLALAKAAEQNLINLAVRLDERSAAFVALGMAKKNNQPAVVLCTSGTAVANLLPALVEAHYSGVALIAITADRPKELINTGVNQTIEQGQIFTKVIDLSLTLDSESKKQKNWDISVKKILKTISQKTQPAHINVHLSEPLVPQAEFKFGPSGDFELSAQEQIEIPEDFSNKKGLIISGDSNLVSTQYINDLANALKWPLISEAPSMAWQNKVSHHPAVLNALPKDLTPEVLLLVGRVGLSRPVAKLIDETSRKIYLANPTALNKVKAEIVSEFIAQIPSQNSDNSWLTAWQQLNHPAEVAVKKRKRVQADLLQVIDHIFENIKDNSHLHLAASLSARDFDLMMSASVAKSLSERGITVSMNRGVNGIDGVVSTAYGLALTEPNRQHYCLLGDVATLHDLAGFAIPKSETPINLHFLIVDNDGGGIFSTLEQAGTENFERVYSTPHGMNLAALLPQLGIKMVTPGANLEVQSAPGISAQIFKIEPISKVKEIRDDIYSSVKKGI
jgi:2-succinyl-5-enolpyruvyl-6-hydroxy-3-cyclohexene-1-carboxylate synthase